jgi:hypothetical protein
MICEVIPNIITDIKLEIICSYFDSSQNLSFLRYRMFRQLNHVTIIRFTKRIPTTRHCYKMTHVVRTVVPNDSPQISHLFSSHSKTISSVNDMATPLIITLVDLFWSVFLGNEHM